MAVTESNYTVSNSSTTNYSFTFPYLKTTDVKLSINGVASSAFTFANATTIQLNSNPTVGDKLRIYRDTDDSKLEAEFFAGSAIKSSDLNDNFNQNLYVTQESNNKIDAAWTSGDETIDNTETWTSNNTRIATTGAIDARVDSKIDTALTTDVAAGNKITVTDNSPGSGQITVALTSGSLVDSDVNASAAIAGTKISPNFGSQNIATTGTVDGRDVSADGIKLDSIETGATADQNAAEIRALVESASDSNVFTNADHTKLNAIEANATADQTNAEIRTAVEAASDSNVFTDADHSKLNAIEASATADQTAGEIKTLLQSDKLTASEIANGTITATQIATGALDGRYYTETESDARYFNVSTGDTIKDGDTFPDNDTTIATTAAINDRIIDLVDDVGGFVPIANETSFPNANPDVNNGTGTIVSIGALAGNLTSNGSGVITIANGTVGNSTVTITGAANSTTYSAGYGLLVETTSTLNTYTFHRLSSKATEVSTVAGNISNINAVANNASNINSAVSNASNINSAVSNASNINSAVSNASNINTVAGNNTNINTVAGANSNITTVAGSISNVNTAAGSISNINTVATNISNVNDFSDKYRVASSAPTSSLDTGDLYFDTSANELKVYNGSAWQGGVTATGNLAGLGSNTFTGNQSLGDNNKVIFGTGSDLEIYHDGTNTRIHNTTGDLIHRTEDQFGWYNAAGSETVATFTVNGSCDLYYDNSKKLETKSWGADVHGILRADNIELDDNHKIKVGNSADLEIYHDGSTSYIDDAGTGILRVRGNEIRLCNTSNETYFTGTENGTAKLYYDDAVKFETTSAGVLATGILESTYEIRGNDNVKFLAGNSNDLQIYHSGTTNYIVAQSHNLHIDTNSGNENAAIFRQNGAVELYYDSSKKFETTSAGVSVTGTFTASSTVNSGGHFKTNSDWNGFYCGASDDLKIYHDGSNSYITNATGHVELNSSWRWADNARVRCGASSDLELYHNGSHSYIQSNTGQLNIHSDAFRLNCKDNAENLITADEGGVVNLYYDGSRKFSTKSYGAFIDGHLQMDDSSVIKLGNSLDLQLYHDGNNSKIINQTGNLTINATASEAGIDITPNGAVELYYDNVLQLDTSATGPRVYGHLRMEGDNRKIILGAGSDLQIYHDGSHSWIKNSTGALVINTDSFQVNNAGQTENIINGTANGAANLYYDNSKKLETTSTGVTVTGTVSDSKGDLRKIPANTQGSAYTLVAADAGKFINASGNITVPPSVFAVGQAITIYNSQASTALSIIRGSGVSVYNAADATDATRTLAGRGIATLLNVGTDTFVISGAGLS